MNDKKTYVMYTLFDKMSKLAMELERHILLDDEQVYSPKLERIKRIRGVDQTVVSYMFPGYLFIETNHQEELFLRIREARGRSIFQYCKMLRYQEYILPLSPEEEQRIRLLCSDEHLVRSSVGYMEGDRLIVTAGPLKDMVGYVKKIDRHKKTALLKLPFMGEERNIIVGLEVLNTVKDII